MAKGIKSGGRDFKPGNPGGGRPKVPQEVRDFQRLTVLEVSRIYNKYFHMNFRELQEALKEPSTTVIELIVGKIMAVAIQKGDQLRLNSLLERVVGSVPKNVSFGVNEDSPGGAKITLYLPENNRTKKPEDDGES